MPPAVMPLPREDKTPPVIKIYLCILDPFLFFSIALFEPKSFLAQGNRGLGGWPGACQVNRCVFMSDFYTYLGKKYPDFYTFDPTIVFDFYAC